MTSNKFYLKLNELKVGLHPSVFDEILWFWCWGLFSFGHNHLYFSTRYLQTTNCLCAPCKTAILSQTCYLFKSCLCLFLTHWKTLFGLLPSHRICSLCPPDDLQRERGCIRFSFLFTLYPVCILELNKADEAKAEAVAWFVCRGKSWLPELLMIITHKRTSSFCPRPWRSRHTNENRKVFFHTHVHVHVHTHVHTYT